MSESKTGHLLWYPLAPGCPYTDHEWRVEREAHDAENKQGLINLLCRLFHLPVPRDPKAAGDAVRASYLSGNRSPYNLRFESEAACDAHSADAIAV
jgi:hypothetical protein